MWTAGWSLSRNPPCLRCLIGPAEVSSLRDWTAPECSAFLWQVTVEWPRLYVIQWHKLLLIYIHCISYVPFGSLKAPICTAHEWLGPQKDLKELDVWKSWGLKQTAIPTSLCWLQRLPALHGSPRGQPMETGQPRGSRSMNSYSAFAMEKVLLTPLLKFAFLLPPNTLRSKLWHLVNYSFKSTRLGQGG